MSLQVEIEIDCWPESLIVKHSELISLLYPLALMNGDVAQEETSHIPIPTEQIAL